MKIVSLGLLSIIAYILCYKLTTERITTPYTGPKKINLFVTMKDISKNRPLLLRLLLLVYF